MKISEPRSLQDVVEDSESIGWRTVGLEHPLVAAHLADARSFLPSIMLHDSACRTKRNRHYKLYRDTDGWYIRVGKRGSERANLIACEITYYQGKPLLFQFKTEEAR